MNVNYKTAKVSLALLPKWSQASQVQMKIQERKFYINFINVILYLDYSSCSQQQFHSDLYPQGITISESL